MTLEQQKAELEEAVMAEHERNCAAFAVEYEALCKKYSLQYIPSMILEGGQAPKVIMKPMAIS